MDLVESGNLFKHLGASLQRLILGFTLGFTAGLVVGTAIGLSSVARAGLTPLVAAIFPIPKIALLPLFIIWFGIGEGSKVATIFFGCFFPTVIATYGGIDSVDRTLIRMGQSFGLSRPDIIRKIVLPAALPAILSGMRISASIAIILLVAAEMIGAEYGIGAYVLLAGNLMATDQLVAGVAILSLLGLAVNFLITRAERRLLAWRDG
jgi:NitT/TauT family transport system permease protein